MTRPSGPDLPRCRRGPKNVFSRMWDALRFRRTLQRGGDVLFEDPPADASVREPRRPRPVAPGGSVALDLPDVDLLR